MSVAAQYIPAAYSLTAFGVWGASDFLGGVGARRANAFLFTAIVHLSSLVTVGTVALMIGGPFLGHASLAWSLLAGAMGGFALALFYRALARGNMGLVAPVAAVLGAAIPTMVTAFYEGFPSYRHLLGFILAGIGVWLISRTEAGVGRPEGLGMAVLAGVGLRRLLSLRSSGGRRLGSVDWHLLARRLFARDRNESFYSDGISAPCPRRCWALPSPPAFSTLLAPSSSSAHRRSDVSTMRS